jgi:hypothetical protein
VAKGWAPLGTDRTFVPFTKSFDATVKIDHGVSRRVHWQRYKGEVRLTCECGADGCEHVELLFEELKEIIRGR